MKEKRKHMRFDVLLDAICGKNSTKKKVTVNNFSREGLGIISDDWLPSGDDVEIEMMIPGDNIPVIVTGEIAWTTPKSADESMYEGGVKLKNIKSSDWSRILNYIYERWMRPKSEGTSE